MGFTTLKETRRGNLVFRVLRATDTGKRFIAMNRWSGHMMIRGPLLSEQNFARLCRVLGEHISPDQSVTHDGTPGVSSDSEIEKAVQRVKTHNVAPMASSKITVLPSMPEFEYVYTCPECYCHTVSYAQLAVGTSAKICSGCGHVYTVSE